jgi:succinate dehydrogenase / fumarate reductase iron-sulfur subunit
MKRRFYIQRFSQEKGFYWQEYVIECNPTWVVLDALEAIHKQDPSLAYRRSCRHGICGACALNINGKNRLACETRVATLPEKIKIKPLPGFPVIRDLVVDLSLLYQHIETVKPYLITKTPPPAKERLQSPEDRKKLDGLYECILCGACTSACPTFWANKNFLGPTALLKACLTTAKAYSIVRGALPASFITFLTRSRSKGEMLFKGLSPISGLSQFL